MTKAAHTPGPWTYQYSPYTSQDEQEIPAFEVHGDEYKVCDTNEDRPAGDPPYITRYCDRSGRRVANDNNDRWLAPAFAEIFRLLKPDTFCVSFYGWNQADRFIAA